MKVTLKDELKNVILGLDIGKKTDHTVLAILERWQAYGYDAFKGENRVGKPHYKLIGMDRLPLDTPHPVQVDHVTKTMKRIEEIYKKQNFGEQGIKPELVVDVGGVGESHIDSYKELGFNVYGVNIHGGRERTYSKRIYGVSKADLTASLAVLLENGRLQIADDLPNRDILIKELMTFSWKQTDTGHFKFEHLKSSDHDDTVLALQVACWYGEKGIRRFETMPIKNLGL